MIEKELQSIYSNQSNITEFKISEIEILASEGDNKEKMILEIKNQIKKIGFEQTAQQIASLNQQFLEGFRLDQFKNAIEKNITCNKTSKGWRIFRGAIMGSFEFFFKII